MARGERGDLRQMGDAEDLPALGELAQVLADRARGVAADAGVDLVEHEQRRRRLVLADAPDSWAPCATLSSASITRESSPPEAISRSGPAGIPGFGAISSSTVSAPRGPQPSSRGRSSTSNARVRHRQLGQPRADRLGERRRGLAASARSARRRARRAPARLRPSSRLPVLERDVGVLELLAARPAALGVSKDVGDRAAVLALQAREQREPLLDLLEPSRRALDPERVAAQLAAEVLGLVAQRLQPLEQRRELRVDAGRRLELRAACASATARPPRSSSSEASASAPAAAAAAGPRGGAAGRARRVSAASSSSLGAAASISSSSNASRSSSRSRAPASSRSSATPLAQAAHVLVRCADPLPQLELRGPAVGVEHVELGGGEHQLAVLVLAVERQQPAAELAQVGDRRRAAADVGARAAVGPHAPGEHDLLGVGRDPLGSAPASSSGGSANTPSTYASAAPARTIPLRARPPSSRSSA